MPQFVFVYDALEIFSQALEFGPTLLVERRCLAQIRRGFDDQDRDFVGRHDIPHCEAHMAPKSPSRRPSLYRTFEVPLDMSSTKVMYGFATSPCPFRSGFMK